MSRQERIDQGGRDQISAMVDNIHSSLNFLASNLQFSGTYLFSEYEAFSSRVVKADVAIALTRDALRAVLYFDAAIRRTTTIVTAFQKAPSASPQTSDDVTMILLEVAADACNVLKLNDDSVRASVAHELTRKKAMALLPDLRKRGNVREERLNALSEQLQRSN